MQSFKGRTIEQGQVVEVYRNLHNGLLSIRDYKTKHVLAHCETVELQGVQFKVSQNGRERVLKEKRKNVHAYAVGRYMGNPEQFSGTSLITYNPYKYKTFVNASTGQAVALADYAFLSKNGMIVTV